MAQNKFTILIADDDVDDQALMKSALSLCKVEVEIVPVYNGVHVMDYLLSRHDYKHITTPPDLLLLDLNMPLMDGFDVLKEIRKQEHLKKLPVYVITTSRNTDHWNKALDLGANGFYTKGSNSTEIINIMREVCEECFEGRALSSK